MAGAILDQFRERFFAARRAGRLPAGDGLPGDPGRQAMLAFHEARVPAALAARIRGALRSVTAPR